MTGRSWRWVVIVVVLGLVVGYALLKVGARRYRHIGAITAFPADAELVQGTDIVFRRSTVGRVARLGESRWGLEVAFRVHDGLELWRAVTVFDRAAARGRRGDSVVVEVRLADAGVVMSVRQGPIALLFIRRRGVWIDGDSRSRGAVTVNGKVPAPGKPLRLLPGDYLGLGGIDVRIGRYLKLTPADLQFTTVKLCPLTGVKKWLPWHPNAAAQRDCANRTVRGASQLVMTETFGLTKPVLKLEPSGGVAGVAPDDSLAIALIPKTDLKAAVEQMVDWLNAPVASRPEPVTHFEYTLANADSMVRSITQVATQLRTTVGTINTALRSPDGLGPVILGAGSHESLQQTLANMAGVTGRLADPTGTLVQNLGLDPIVSRTQRSLVVADSTMDLVREHVLRLAPRVELAADKVTSSMEGIEATLQSVKTAAQDFSEIKNTLKSGTTKWSVRLAGVLAAIAWFVGVF